MSVMEMDWQMIRDECRTVASEYCHCNVSRMDVRRCIEGLAFMDIYEICLDVAQRVKGEREMDWDEFQELSRCLFTV